MMRSNFSVFRERLAEACRLREMTNDKLCSSIGLGGRRAVDLGYSGLKALDIYRLAQIAPRQRWLAARALGCDGGCESEG